MMNTALWSTNSRFRGTALPLVQVYLALTSTLHVKIFYSSKLWHLRIMQHICMLVSLTICEAGSKPCLLASNCVSSWPLRSHPALSLPRQYT